MITLAVIIVYMLTLGFSLYIIAEDEDFDTVGDLCGWVYENHPLVFVPVVNTFCLIIAVILYPCIRIATKIANIKLPKKKKRL